jgi:glutaredoxin 3
MMCPFCYRAKRLLEQKGVTFEEHDVSTDPAGRATMRRRAKGGSTVPQIFIDDVPVGGFDELYALDRQGRLDPMLVA